MRSAPRDSVTEMTMGNSSGVSPTASATEKRKDSSSGRCMRRWASITKSTSSTVSRMSISPNTSARAEPLITEVPMKTALRASAGLAPAGASPGFFSTG